MTMLAQLTELVNTTSPNVLGQVLKSTSNVELYNWVLTETTELENVPIKARVLYILQGKPNLTCKYGKNRKFNQKLTKIGYCGNVKTCQCFRDQVSEQAKQFDMKNVVEKRKITWKQKYGPNIENISQVDQIKKKRKETMALRDYSALFSRMQYEKETHGFNTVVERISADVIPNFTRDNYFGTSSKYIYSWKCVHCGNIFDGKIESGKVPRCKICFPDSVSKGERDIKEFVESLGLTVVSNDRTVLNGIELDILIPEKSVAIEFNGIYWHSTKFRKPNYHVKKYIDCKNAGIHLIQIFEDEWVNNPDIIKSRLKSVLGMNEKLYARKCTIAAVKSYEYKEFLEKHHLQGYAPASIVYGLRFNDELIAVMSFGKSRYTNDSFEMIRYCSKGNVVGGASKLFLHFVKVHGPESVVSYANRCWSNGNLYRTLGFIDVTPDQLNTGYFYVKNNKRYHRSNFTKKRLISMGYDQALSERQIMENNGYHKVYDCGNYKFLWQPNKNTQL